jgi:predicted deacylase
MTPAPSVFRELIDVGDGAIVELRTIKATRPGPTVSVLGGVHGDELEGVAAARMLIRSASASLHTGRLRVVAVANPLAFAARTRQTPADGNNLARCFPGHPEGAVTERIADVLTRQVIAGSDLVIDLHSAGAAYSMPLFVGCLGGEGSVSQRSVNAATMFGAPLGWLHATFQPGRSASAALALGIPVIYAEGGGGAALRRDEVSCYVDGVRRILASLGNLPDSLAEPPPMRWIVGGDGDVDASITTTVDGWCLVAVAAGDEVRAGDLVAEVIDEHGDVVERIVAQRRATVMMLRRRAEVSAGDGIVMYGPPAEART